MTLKCKKGPPKFLGNITIHGPAQAAAVDGNAIPALVGLLESSGNNAIVMAACVALRNITADLDRVRMSVVNANAMVPITRLLPSNDIALQALAAEILCQISFPSYLIATLT